MGWTQAFCTYCTCVADFLVGLLTVKTGSVYDTVTCFWYLSLLLGCLVLPE